MRNKCTVSSEQSQQIIINQFNLLKLLLSLNIELSKTSGLNRHRLGQFYELSLMKLLGQFRERKVFVDRNLTNYPVKTVNEEWNNKIPMLSVTIGYIKG